MFTRDLLERTIATFVQGYLAAWVIAGQVLNVEAFDALFSTANAKLGLAAGVLAVAKNLIGAKIPGSAKDSGSWLPAEQDPPQP